jgi:hypothetical protein
MELRCRGIIGLAAAEIVLAHAELPCLGGCRAPDLGGCAEKNVCYCLDGIRLRRQAIVHIQRTLMAHGVKRRF